MPLKQHGQAENC